MTSSCHQMSGDNQGCGSIDIGYSISKKYTHKYDQNFVYIIKTFCNNSKGTGSNNWFDTQTMGHSAILPHLLPGQADLNPNKLNVSVLNVIILKSSSFPLFTMLTYLVFNYPKINMK